MSAVNRKSLQDDMMSMGSALKSRSYGTAPPGLAILKVGVTSPSEVVEIPPANISVPISEQLAISTVSIEEDKASTDTQQVDSLGTQLSALSSRLAQLELKIAQLESGNGHEHQKSTAESKSTSPQVHLISRQVEMIMEGLGDTPDYNIGRTFSCGSCGSMGGVAIRVKCTRCNYENWWGRWPQKQAFPGSYSSTLVRQAETNIDY